MSLKSAIENAKARVSAAFDAVVAKGGTKPSVANLAALPSAIESIPSGGGNSPYYDADGEPIPMGLVIPNRTTIVSVIDNETELIRKNEAFRVLASVEKIQYNALVSLQELSPTGSADNCWHFNGLSKLREIIFPELLYLRGDRIFEGATNLRRLSIPNWYGFFNIGSGYYFNFVNLSGWFGYSAGFDNLIDFESGKNWSKSISLIRWRGNNALLTDSSSLVDDGEPFANNREKLLYNIREHLAKNLNPSVTATITFNATIGAAIDADEETKAAFPASWTILY